MTDNGNDINYSTLVSRRDALKAGAVGAGVVGLGVYGSSTAVAQTASDFISGTVLDAQGGSPVQGATVVAVPHSADGTHRSDLDPLEATTDANGDYEFDATALHGEEVYYHVICRNGDQNDPERGQENYPWILAEGSGIPDEGDLKARYDATELSLSDTDSVNTWPDETGNGNDLTAGNAPVYRTGIINGNPVVRFDGVDDYLNVSFTSLSQPNQIFIVFQYQSISDDFHPAYDSINGTNRHSFQSNGADQWRMFAGSLLDGGTTDTNPHIHNGLFDGANSVSRLDGSQIASGDAGTEQLDGFTVGSEYDQTSWAPVDIGEILIYPQDKSGIQSDVETYLSDKWGITL